MSYEWTAWADVKRSSGVTVPTQVSCVTTNDSYGEAESLFNRLYGDVRHIYKVEDQESSKSYMNNYGFREYFWLVVFFLITIYFL